MVQHINSFYLKLCKILGIEKDLPLSDKGKQNTEKLQNSLSRTRSTIFELATCNDWDIFITLTINPVKYDRENFALFYKDFSKFLNNYNYQNGYNIKYLLIPELHKDKKSWHIHGLIKNLPKEKLFINKNGYLDWLDYSKKFGYNSISIIDNKEATSKYITKYITKEMQDNIKLLNNHLYFCSKGLERAKELFRGFIVGDTNIVYDFKNDYVSIKNIPNIEELKNYLTGKQLLEMKKG